ncbi:hypothetical protein E2C01_026928 [Portunus trituberculatus]|uniref:Uncharacterized protein n=1 Tax=Portunus trituberculatus TaxID=210409 RepID=A0A5B7EKK1_PORTR|nr:hypothetical protein [Portunus trituberculatus]
MYKSTIANTGTATEGKWLMGFDVGQFLSKKKRIGEGRGGLAGCGRGGRHEALRQFHLDHFFSRPGAPLEVETRDSTLCRPSCVDLASSREER